MRGYTSLLYGFLRREVELLRQYPVNTIGQSLSFLLYFGVIFYGGQHVAGPSIGDSLGALIIGFFLWSIGQHTFTSLVDTIHLEAQWGTLEQLFLSKYPFGVVLLAAGIATVSVSLTIAVFNLGIILLVTGKSFSFDPVVVLPVMALTLCSMMGLSFLFAGCAIIYKKIRGLMGLIQFVFVGFLAAGLADAVMWRLLPLAQGMWMLDRSLNEGLSVAEFPLLDHALIVGTGLGYLALGYLVFRYAQRHARRQGVIGEY